MIRLESVSKVYHTHNGDVRALDDVSLVVETGEFVSVRGSSGCGKSTLLLAVAGMARPTSGRVLLDGECLYDLPVHRRARVRAEKVGFVFQMFHLVPYLNVIENVLLPTLAGARPDRHGAEAIIERLGISDRLHHRPSELSMGERQRVALARALLTRPKVILADEPTGNLDPANAQQVLSYLSEFHQAGGTVLLVTHHQAAETSAQRTLRMEQGRLLAEA